MSQTNFHPGYLNQGDPLGLTTTQVPVTADNQLVLTAGFSLIQLIPDNATATNRTITLSSGDAGYLGQQVLVLENIAGSSYTLQLADGGNCALQADWTPVQYDTITLIWDGSYWVEQCRAGSTGVLPFTLASGDIIVGNAGNVATAVAMSGVVAIDNAGATTVPLTSARILVGNGSNLAAPVAVTGIVALTNAGVTSIPVVSGNILVGSAGGIAASVTMSGDATIIASGALTLAPVVTARTAAITISQAQMQALSTPVQLVAAAGAGTVIVVDQIEILHTYSTAVYATGSNVSIEYATTGNDIALIVSTFFTAGASANTIIKPSSYDLDASTGTGSGFDVTANANKAIQIVASNFTNGNAANIFKIKTTYHVVTLMT